MKELLQKICSKYTNNFGINLRKDLNKYEIKLGKEGASKAEQIAKEISNLKGIKKIKVDKSSPVNDVVAWIDVYPEGRVEDSMLKDNPIKTKEGTFPLVNESEESLKSRGYVFSHISEDGKYKIMRNHKRNSAVAIKASDSKMKDDNITLNNLPKKPNEERWFQLLKPFGEYNVVRVRCETDWRKGEGNIAYGMVAFSSRTNHWGKHASSDLSSGWGLGNNFKLQDVLKFLKEHQANVSSKKALYGDSKPKDSLKSFVFTSKDSGRKFIVKAKNTQDAITKFYNAVNDSKVKDAKYAYLASPTTESDVIEKAKKLGLSISKVGGLMSIQGELSKFAKLFNTSAQELEKASEQMMSAFKKVEDSTPSKK